MQVSFIVPLFNHLEVSQAMLCSLLKSLPKNLEFEVIIIDDFSVDGTREWLTGLDHKRIRCILNDQNLGYAKSNNLGANFAIGEFLCLLNNDLVFYAGWLEPMLKLINIPHLRTGVVGNLQYRVADGRLDHAGVELGLDGKFNHVSGAHSEPPTFSKINFVTGACLLIRNVDFEAVGRFDENFVNGCEDIDLCLKVRASGKSIYVCNESKIKHHVSLTRSRTSLQNERNSRLLYKKWRDAIKAELTMKWARALAAGEAAYGEHVQGSLLPDFVARPQIAARLIAEAKLQGLEHYWQRTLDGVEPNAGVGDRVRAHGLRFVEQLAAYVLKGGVTFEIDGLLSARNFYVCGRIVQDFDPTQLAITLTVNRIQKQTFMLGGDGWNFNVGIIDPILLQGVPNKFELSVHQLDASGQPINEVPQALILTHIVVDDQVVRQFH